MGNRSSKTVETSAAPTSAPSGEESEVTVVTQSGVFLANELQTEIVNAFQTSNLQAEWEKLQTKIITSHNERVITAAEHIGQIQNELAQWRQHNEEVQSSLNNTLDSLNAKFADKEVELQFNVDQLEKRIGSVPVFGQEKGTGMCLDERTKLMNCYSNKSGDIRDCDDIVKAMERCTKKAVVS
ncbi:hypothetical protein CTEN210_04696 [Chaetoceros tenuissimus]|uniref:Uncharacterized protein n=1 Tax=Chaetoceros tenuissimus TaxID=426638 RepID=A0AAD3CNB3_9STRA|nr:hypothetical protein CTEN210_04696 [Chaetoceros tenuissimus]